MSKEVRSYIKLLLREAAMPILIPPPPHESYRVAELDVVKDQYENKKNPEALQDVLDKDYTTLFNELVKSAGHPCSAGIIEDVNKILLPIIFDYKQHFDSLRPTQLAKKVGHPFRGDHLLESAQTASYPSGHTTQAFYLAHFLSDMYPDLKEQLLVLAQMIADSRIDRGVHFPSDNAAGKQLAETLFMLSKK